VISTADHSVIDTVKFTVKGARDADITPVGITFGKDGKQVYVALGRANHVAFVDAATRKQTALVLVGKRAWNVTLNAAESRLYVINGLSDDLTIVDVAAVKAIKTVPVGRVPYGLVVVE
jgi:YVTN family beta-propeller protein